MMSSGTLTERPRPTLQPWQLFSVAGVAGATPVMFVTNDAGPAAVVVLSLTVVAALAAGTAAWRMLALLIGLRDAPPRDVRGSRTRAALESEKRHVLRAIKELEFDRAMRKVSEKDFSEMSARLRGRAMGLMRQLDRGTGYRADIERDLARRTGRTAVTRRTRRR